MDLEHDPRTARTEDQSLARGSRTRSAAPKDYFIERNGVRYAGVHLIIDLLGAERLDDLDHVEATLRRCIQVAGATLLHIHLHHFSPFGGVSGVAVLAESHISIHTWPERDYAALDIFMCGDTNPHLAVEVLREAFAPKRLVVSEHLRGKGA
jgi:S-adenosylmethionine decarboxylase